MENDNKLLLEDEMRRNMRRLDALAQMPRLRGRSAADRPLWWRRTVDALNRRQEMYVRLVKGAGTDDMGVVQVRSQRPRSRLARITVIAVQGHRDMIQHQNDRASHG